MEAIIATLAVTLGASFCAGINLYATLFVLGAMSRWSGFDLPGDLLVLESDLVMWPALFMYTVEFVADKVPAVDSAWDSIHAFIRIPAGVMLAAAALGDVPLELQVVGGMVGGTLATSSFAAKATTRLASHATGTSPIASPVLSIAEDALVVGTMAFVAANPVLSLLILAVLMIATYYVLKTFWRIARGVFRSIGGLLKGEYPAVAATPAPALASVPAERSEHSLMR